MFSSFGGTGLGLWISKSIANVMGGNIHVIVFEMIILAD
jgi:signal transduction histidine kinase